MFTISETTTWLTLGKDLTLKAYTIQITRELKILVIENTVHLIVFQKINRYINKQNYHI